MISWLCRLVVYAASDSGIGYRARNAAFRALGFSVDASARVKTPEYIGKGILVISEGVFINRGSYFDLTAKIEIGNNVVIGHGVTFITAGHSIGRSTRRAGEAYGTPISIGSGCWIGANVTVMPGVKIGKGCVVAAGAVVINDVPDDSMIAGVPAKIKRSLEGANE